MVCAADEGVLAYFGGEVGVPELVELLVDFSFAVADGTGR